MVLENDDNNSDNSNNSVEMVKKYIVKKTNIDDYTMKNNNISIKINDTSCYLDKTNGNLNESNKEILNNSISNVLIKKNELVVLKCIRLSYKHVCRIIFIVIFIIFILNIFRLSENIKDINVSNLDTTIGKLSNKFEYIKNLNNNVEKLLIHVNNLNETLYKTKINTNIKFELINKNDKINNDLLNNPMNKELITNDDIFNNKKSKTSC